MASLAHTDRTRRLAGAAAALVWAGLALELYLHVRLALGFGQGVGFGLLMYLGVFTVLTNLLVALALTVLVAAPRSRLGRFLARDHAVTGITANALLAAIAYGVFLAPTLNPDGLQLIADVVLHYVTPALFTAYWWFLVPKGELSVEGVLFWVLYPLGYLLYTFLRGQLLGSYPFPFLDVNAITYLSAVLGGQAVVGGFLVLGLALLVVGQLQDSRRGAAKG